MRLRIAALAGAAALALALAAVPAADASCAVLPDLPTAVRTADIVFVGTVTSTTEGDRWAAVQVEEVWRGPDLEASVVVKGGPGGNTATSVDRTFLVGQRYLFFPFSDPQQGLTDNSCSPTTSWAEAMAALRPANVRAPVGSSGGNGLGDLLVPVVVALAVAGVLLVMGLAARGRRAD